VFVVVFLAWVGCWVFIGCVIVGGWGFGCWAGGFGVGGSMRRGFGGWVSVIGLFGYLYASG